REGSPRGPASCSRDYDANRWLASGSEERRRTDVARGIGDAHEQVGPSGVGGKPDRVRLMGRVREPVLRLDLDPLLRVDGVLGLEDRRGRVDRLELEDARRPRQL